MDELSLKTTVGHSLTAVFIAWCLVLSPSQLLADTGTPALSFESCVIQGPAGAGQARGQCATLSVPESYAKPDGRRLSLRVFKLATRHHTANADAVTFIQGGPGGSSVELAVLLGLQHSNLRRNRDIVLLDQRGTGQSAPLRCNFNEQQLQTLNDEDIDRLAKLCVTELSDTADLQQYTTSVAVKDLEALRTALNYSKWNLVAGSYGTRVAQHYLRRYPEGVRTVTIEGVVPTGMEIISSVPGNAQLALEKLFSQCSGNPLCQEAFPNLSARFTQLQKSIAVQPLSITIAHPTTGDMDSIEFNTAALNLAVRMMLYSPESKSLLPLLIDQASNGKYGPLAAQAMLFSSQLNESMNIGMHNSVVCSEDMRQLTLNDKDKERIRASFLGMEFVNFMTSICRSWPKGVVDQDFFTPFTSSHPILLISGEYDPVTPASNADQAARHFVNSMHVIAPGQGHSLYHPACARGLIDNFVRNGSVEKLDTSCFDRLDGPAFFTSTLGHAP